MSMVVSAVLWDCVGTGIIGFNQGSFASVT